MRGFILISLLLSSLATATPALDFDCQMEYKAVNPKADFKIFAGRDFAVTCTVTNLSQKTNGGGKVKIISPDEWTVHGIMDFKEIGPGKSVKGIFTIRAPARSTVRPKVFPVIGEIRLGSGAVITKAFLVELADPFIPRLTIHYADAKAIRASIDLRGLYPGQEIKNVSAYAAYPQGLKVMPDRQTFDFPAKKSLSLTYARGDKPGFALRAVTMGIKADEHIVRLRTVMEAPLPLGIRTRASGLWMNDFKDGQTVQAEVGDKACRQTVKNESGDMRYMYFAASPNFPTAGMSYIAITYFDGAEGSFAIQYDAKDCEYKGSNEVIVLDGTNEWKQTTFTLPDIRFDNRQNGESDFRLAVKGADLSVSEIAVSKYSVD